MGLKIDSTRIVITDRSGFDKFDSNDKLTYLYYAYETNNLSFSTSSQNLNVWYFSNNKIPDINDNAIIVAEIDILSVSGNNELGSVVGKTVPFSGIIPLTLDVIASYNESYYTTPGVYTQARTTYLGLQRKRLSDGSNQLWLSFFWTDGFGNINTTVIEEVTFNFRYRIYYYQ